jgi:mannose-6-phosphate isomerase-like protein (cupin superfamily)
MQLRNLNIEINEGEFFIVPQGIEHRPIAENEVWVMLFEPASTLNTGNVIDDKTKTDLEKI